MAQAKCNNCGYPYAVAGGRCPNCGASMPACFITTAVCISLQLGDDCHELQVLRSYRDSYMKETPDRCDDIELYYRIAPRIVDAIQSVPTCVATYKRIYKKHIKPAVEAIEDGNRETARILYQEMVRQLETEFLNGERYV